MHSTEIDGVVFHHDNMDLNGNLVMWTDKESLELEDLGSGKISVKLPTEQIVEMVLEMIKSREIEILEDMNKEDLIKRYTKG